MSSTSVKSTDFLTSCTATLGYAYDQADADMLNAATSKPETLTFIPKP